MLTLAFPAEKCLWTILANGLREEDDYFDDGTFADLLNSLDIEDEDWDEDDDEDDDEEENEDDEDEE